MPLSTNWLKLRSPSELKVLWSNQHIRILVSNDFFLACHCESVWNDLPGAKHPRLASADEILAEYDSSRVPDRGISCIDRRLVSLAGRPVSYLHPKELQGDLATLLGAIRISH